MKFSDTSFNELSWHERRVIREALEAKRQVAQAAFNKAKDDLEAIDELLPRLELEEDK